MEGLDSCYAGPAPWAESFEKIDQLKHLHRGVAPTPEQVKVNEIIYRPVLTRDGNEHTKK
jgi:hypothetical protein